MTFFTSQPVFSHCLNSFNNAAQTTRTTNNSNKRSSLLRGLFGRYSSKKRVPIAQSLPQKNIPAGDHNHLVSTNIKSFEEKEQQQCYDINLQDDTTIKQDQVNDRFGGLRYDFQHIKNTSIISTADIKQSSKSQSMSHL